MSINGLLVIIGYHGTSLVIEKVISTYQRVISGSLGDQCTLYQGLLELVYHWLSLLKL